MTFNISVLMSVYNAEKPECLSAAIESVFMQTLKPKEVVLVKDGPLGPELEKVISYWQNKERDVLKIVQLEKNMGLAHALNSGLENCSCDLVARMDSNDISSQDRFEKETKCLNDSGADVVGSYIEERDESMNGVVGIRKVPLVHDDITSYLRWKNPMNHMTVIFRRSAVVSVGGYPRELRKLQDYGLWAKMIKAGYKFKNIPESLVLVRTGEDFLNRRGGLGYFKYEFTVLSYLRKMGHIGIMCFIGNVVIRFFARVCPRSLRGLIYRKIRNS